MILHNADLPAGTRTRGDHAPPRPVAAPAPATRITGIDIPFWDLVIFMVKFAIATIPAGFILFVAMTIISGLLGGIAAGL